MKKFLSEKQLAEQLGISVYVLRNDRWSRKGFPYFKIGGSIRYALEDVVEHREKHAIKHEDIKRNDI